MAYVEQEIRERVDRRGRSEADRVQRDLPPTAREEAARRNPLTLDITDASIVGLAMIGTMTT